MSLAYRLMYRLGFTPWDRVLPAELKDLITGPNALPPGRALDMGSGKGGKAIFMAQHGWRVTAVENVPSAMKVAMRKAAEAGVTIDFKEADVTRLESLGLEPGYSLVFDFGCYHGLSGKQRDAYGKGVNAVAAPNATLLLMGFTKALPPVPVGVSEADLAAHLGPRWRLAWTKPTAGGNTSAMDRAAAAWFCLVRTG